MIISLVYLLVRCLLGCLAVLKRHRRRRSRRPGPGRPVRRPARRAPQGRLIARPSFFQLDNLRRARAKGEPWHLIVHEDVLIFRNPLFPGGSRELKGAQRELRGAARRFSHNDPGVAGELGAAA